MASSESAELRKIISWSDYDELVSSIASQLGDWEPDAIVGLTRGGLVPAVSLSHRYNAKLYCLNISLRDGKASSAGFDWRRLEKFRRSKFFGEMEYLGPRGGRYVYSARGNRIYR